MLMTNGTGTAYMAAPVLIFAFCKGNTQFT